VLAASTLHRILIAHPQESILRLINQRDFHAAVDVSPGVGHLRRGGVETLPLAGKMGVVHGAGQIAAGHTRTADDLRNVMAPNGLIARIFALWRKSQ